MKRSSNYAGDMVTLPLAGKPTGERLKIIREKLEEMYPGEYSTKKVAEQCGLSYYGLRKLETGSGEPRLSTIQALADFYNVPLSQIYPDKKPGMFKLDTTFFLGKKEDMEPYFDEYIANWGQPHFLDPRREYPPGTFEEIHSQEIVYDENGNPSFEDVSIEVSIKVFQNQTNTLVIDRALHGRTPVSKDDIKVLEELIEKQVKILSEYYVRLKQAQRQD